MSARGDVTDPADATLTEVAAGVLAYVQPDGSWWINNAGAVTGDGGTIVVDTCATEVRTRRFLEQLRAATGDAPIPLAVNTHLHGDHTHGNCLLPATTAIVAHEATRAGILVDFILANPPPIWEPLPVWGDLVLRPPTVTLRSDVTLHTGDRAVELRHPGGPAHTAGDVVAWVPDVRALFTGDLVFHGVTPLVFMGDLDGALRSLDWLAAFEPEVVIPGHGPVLTGAELPAVLATHERYYRFVQDTAAQARADGLSPLEAAQLYDLGEFSDLPDAERIVLNLHRAYATADGVELNIGAAFWDAMQYHGGPLRCAV